LRHRRHRCGTGGEFHVPKDLCWIPFSDPRRDGVRDYRPSPAYPNADQNAQTDLYAYQCGYSDSGGHGDGDTIADGHPNNEPDGHARACSYGHTCAHGYASTHEHARADRAATTAPHPRTNVPTRAPSDPDA
jgi:hypothetical protein